LVKEYRNFINGSWKKSNSGKLFNDLNPATKRVIGMFQESDENDINEAVDAAESSLKGWSNTPAPKRAEILFEISRLLRKDKERLARIMTIEMGKVLKESRGDVQEAIDIFEFMAGEGRRLYGITTPSELKNKFCMTVRKPIGICALITPWNFPIAIPSWKLAPALIGGNTVVFKPSSDTPLCAIELIKVLDKAKVPKGVVNLVTGGGNLLGNSLIKHKKIRSVSFTGSRDTGDYIIRNAGIKKVGLELGGKNAIIVMDDANLELAVDGIVWGAFGTTGQRCTAASRIIVHKKIKKKLELMLLKKIKRLKLGNGLDKKVDIGPLINERALEKVHHYTEIGKYEGAKLLCGGKKLEENGFYYQPTVFSNGNTNMKIAQEEIFGPVVVLIPVEDLNEAIEACNSVSYGLSSSIYTNNIENAFKAIEKIEAGIVYCNSSTIGAEVHLPFGGVKETGNGTREGSSGIEEFTEIKTVYIDYSGKLQKAQIDID